MLGHINAIIGVSSRPLQLETFGSKHVVLMFKLMRAHPIGLDNVLFYVEKMYVLKNSQLSTTSYLSFTPESFL